MRRLAYLLPLALAACGTEAPGHLVVDRGAVDWGTAARGDRSIVALQIANDGEGPLALELVPPAPPFALDGTPPSRLRAGESVALQLIFAPEEAGSFASTIAFRTEGGTLEIPLAGAAVPWAIACDPIDFGSVIQGTGAVREARCTAATNAPVRATPGTPLGSGAAAFATDAGPFDFEPGVATRIPVSFSAGSPGTAHAQLPLRAATGRVLGELTLDGISIPSALSVEPNASCGSGGFFLGAAAPGYPVEKKLTLRNRSAAPIAVEGLAFADPDFSVEPGGSIELGPGEATELSVRFVPPDVGIHEAWMRLSTGEQLCFRAIGAGPAIRCTPTALDLGAARPGETRTGTITCTVEPRLYEEGGFRLVSVESDEASVAVEAPAASSWASGATFELPVSWTAGTAGALQAHVILRSDDPRTPLLSVPVQARSLSVDCPLPGTLAFGSVSLDEERKLLHLDFFNPGKEPCYLAPMRFDPASDGFTATGALPTAGSALSPGQHRAFELAFTPRHDGLHTGSIAVEGSGSIALRANGGRNCLVTVPVAADLGAAAPGCDSLRLNLHVYNWCPDPITIDRVDTGIRAPAGVLQATTQSPLPATIAYQGAIDVQLSFRDARTGTFYESLAIWERNNPVATIVEVSGTTVDWGPEVDEFLWTEDTSHERTYPVRDVDGDGAIEDPEEISVARNGVRVPSSGAAQINWSYDPSTAVLRFVAFEPEPGDVIRVAYRAPCGR